MAIPSTKKFDPTRLEFNLDMRTLDRCAVLVHGITNVGKTYLMGDFLKTEAQHGKVAFIDVLGEGGSMSLADLGLSAAGHKGYRVTTRKELTELLDWLGTQDLRALAFDSLKAFVRLVIAERVGADRMPVVSRASDENEWGDIHFRMERMAGRLGAVAPWIMAACLSDRSVEQISGATYVTPDLPGREAAGSISWFDLAGYLRADTSPLPGNPVTRTFMVAPNNKILTRQRLPRPIKVDIELPEGPGGWATIKRHLEAALVPSGEEPAEEKEKPLVATPKSPRVVTPKLTIGRK